MKGAGSCLTCYTVRHFTVSSLITLPALHHLRAGNGGSSLQSHPPASSHYRSFVSPHSFRYTSLVIRARRVRIESEVRGAASRRVGSSLSPLFRRVPAPVVASPLESHASYSRSVSVSSLPRLSTFVSSRPPRHGTNPPGEVE